MRWDLDCRAEAERAMRQALEATTAIDRANWVRAALAWQDLARDQAPPTGEVPASVNQRGLMVIG